jgi:hypothetical protein
MVRVLMWEWLVLERSPIAAARGTLGVEGCGGVLGAEVCMFAAPTRVVVALRGLWVCCFR